MSINNLIQFPKKDLTYSQCLEKIINTPKEPWIQDLYDKIWQVSENSDIVPEVQPLQPSSDEQIQSIIDNQARINYYLSEIEMFGPAKF